LGYRADSRFQCNFALKDSRSAGDLIRSIRNGARIYVALEQAARLSAYRKYVRAAATGAAQPQLHKHFQRGWPAYEFDETSIARKSDGSSSVQLSSRVLRIRRTGFR